MTADDFRALALAFPETSEEPHFDRTSFRVNKKIFATMAADGSNGMVRVSPPERLNALLLDYPEMFFSFGGYTVRNGSLGVTLANADPALVRELMAGSFAHSAPKRLLK